MEKLTKLLGIDINGAERQQSQQKTRETAWHRKKTTFDGNMYLMYFLDDQGQRVYTLNKVDPNGKPTLSAHPARFSPEDQVNRDLFPIVQSNIFQRLEFHNKSAPAHEHDSILT